MKISDIKGKLGEKIYYWVAQYINNLVFNEIEMNNPGLKSYDHVSLGRMEGFRKLLSGKRIGFPTHGCESGEIPFKNWSMSRPSLRREKNIEINNCVIDVCDPDGLFNIEIDIVDDRTYWCTMNWSIKANKEALISKINEMFDDDLKKVKNTIHKDILGKKLEVGDIICYSTTLSNNVHIGTIEKFNDCNMIVSGHSVQYDAGVLAVNDTVVINNDKYESRSK